MSFVLLTMILANTVNFSVLPKLSSVPGGGKHSYAYVENIYFGWPIPIDSMVL